MTVKGERFSSQADPELLAALRDLAKRDGRHFQVVLEEAIRDYIEARAKEKPRASVMAHFDASMVKNHRLGELLAKRVWPFQGRKSASGIRVKRWGDLSNEDCAEYGLESFMGMVTEVHHDCHDFWCSSEADLVMMVKFYVGNSLLTENRESYIGAYLWWAKQYAEDGIPVLDERPLQKLIIQPLDDGNVAIIKGYIDHDKVVGSSGELGLIDQRTAEYLAVNPCRVPDIPQYPTDTTPTFFCQRTEGTWHLARLASDSEDKEEDLQLHRQWTFASIPENPNRTTKTYLKSMDEAG